MDATVIVSQEGGVTENPPAVVVATEISVDVQIEDFDARRFLLAFGIRAPYAWRLPYHAWTKPRQHVIRRGTGQ